MNIEVLEEKLIYLNEDENRFTLDPIEKATKDLIAAKKSVTPATIEARDNLNSLALKVGKLKKIGLDRYKPEKDRLWDLYKPFRDAINNFEKACNASVKDIQNSVWKFDQAEKRRIEAENKLIQDEIDAYAENELRNKIEDDRKAALDILVPKIIDNDKVLQDTIRPVIPAPEPVFKTAVTGTKTELGTISATEKLVIESIDYKKFIESGEFMKYIEHFNITYKASFLNSLIQEHGQKPELFNTPGVNYKMTFKSNMRVK